MKTVMTIAVGVLVGVYAPLSIAQTNVYTDRNGAVIGYGTRNGNVTTYTDSIGRVQGYETRQGNTSTYTNSIGAVEGYRNRSWDSTDRYGVDPARRGGWKDD